MEAFAPKKLVLSTHEDMIAEAKRIVDVARGQGIIFRLIGDRGFESSPRIDDARFAVYATATAKCDLAVSRHSRLTKGGGEYFISDAKCPHMGGHLPDGKLEGTILTCPRHHSQFDLRDGRVLRWTDWEGVKLDVGKLLRHPRPLRTYAVKIEGDNILVGPENAPPTAA